VPPPVLLILIVFPEQIVVVVELAVAIGLGETVIFAIVGGPVHPFEVTETA
jgi:hypothetical protein